LSVRPERCRKIQNTKGLPNHRLQGADAVPSRRAQHDDVLRLLDAWLDAQVAFVGPAA
jgi:hypothetical protein